MCPIVAYMKLNTNTDHSRWGKKINVRLISNLTENETNVQQRAVINQDLVFLSKRSLRSF